MLAWLICTRKIAQKLKMHGCLSNECLTGCVNSVRSKLRNILKYRFSALSLPDGTGSVSICYLRISLTTMYERRKRNAKHWIYVIWANQQSEYLESLLGTSGPSIVFTKNPDKYIDGSLACLYRQKQSFLWRTPRNVSVSFPRTFERRSGIRRRTRRLIDL